MEVDTPPANSQGALLPYVRTAFGGAYLTLQSSSEDLVFSFSCMALRQSFLRQAVRRRRPGLLHHFTPPDPPLATVTPWLASVANLPRPDFDFGVKLGLGLARLGLGLGLGLWLCLGLVLGLGLKLENE